MNRSVLFAVVCIALLWTAIQGETGIRIFFLKFREYIRSNLINLSLSHYARWQNGHDMLEQTLDNAKPPLAHDERFRDINSSDRDGHNSGMGWGGDFAIRSLIWPGLCVVVPDITGEQRCQESKDKAAECRKNKVTDFEIPSGLELRPPCEVLASGTLNDSAESNIRYINAFTAFGAVQIVTNPLSYPDRSAINESGERIFGHDGSVQVSANRTPGDKVKVWFPASLCGIFDVFDPPVEFRINADDSSALLITPPSPQPRPASLRSRSSRQGRLCSRL